MTEKHKAAIRVLLDFAGKANNLDPDKCDVIDVVLSVPGLCEAVGAPIRTPDGLYRMVRCDPALHQFLGDIYECGS